MRTSLAIAGVLFASASIALPASAAKMQTAPAVVNIVATADQKFSPDHVVLHVGKRQTLRFTSAGGVHGIASKPLGIPSTTIAPGKPVSVMVLATKTGSYTVPCSIVCGPNHADMALTIDVKR